MINILQQFAEHLAGAGLVGLPTSDRWRGCGMNEMHLDSRQGKRDSGDPKDRVRRIRRLCAAPQREKSGLSCFCQQSATGASYGRCYISAEQRPVSVRTGGLTRAGERCFAFFCVQIPKQTMRCLMSSQHSLSAHELAQLQESVREHSRQLALAAVWLSDLKNEVANLQNTIMPRSVAVPEPRRGKATIIPFSTMRA